MDHYLFSLSAILVLSFTSYFGGKMISTLFPIESKILACITGAVFLFISLFIISIYSGIPTLALLFEKSLRLVIILVPIGGYSGFLSNFRKDEPVIKSSSVEKDI